jgi:hypothetical protein
MSGAAEAVLGGGSRSAWRQNDLTEVDRECDLLRFLMPFGVVVYPEDAISPRRRIFVKSRAVIEDIPRRVVGPGTRFLFAISKGKSKNMHMFFQDRCRALTPGGQNLLIKLGMLGKILRVRRCHILKATFYGCRTRPVAQVLAVFLDP